MTFRMQPSSAGAWSPPSASPSGTQNFVDLIKPSNDTDSKHFSVPITSQSATPFTTLQYPYPANLQKILLENDGVSNSEWPDTASNVSDENPDFATQKLLETFLQSFNSTAVDPRTLEVLGLNSRPVSVKSESDNSSIFSFIEQSRSPSPLNSESTLVQSWPLEEIGFTSVSESPSLKEEIDESLQRLLLTLKPTAELYCHDKPPIDAPPPRRRSNANVEANGPPRPANAFILYRRQQQAHLRRSCQGIHLRTASKLIAIWWKNESDAVKAHYRAEAVSEKKLHQVKYPDYQYRPKGNKERKAIKPILKQQQHQHQPTGTKELLDFYYSPLPCENRPQQQLQQQQQQLQQQQVAPLFIHNYDDPFTGFAFLCGYQRQLPFNQ